MCEQEPLGLGCIWAYTFTPLWEGGGRSAMAAAVAQLYLGSMTFFAAREARAASGSAWRLSSPQLRL